MAISAACVWEVRTAGNDTNGGGFVTGASGSDWSQQDGKRTGADVTDISTTDAVANGTTTITSATANFATTIVGNIIFLSGGTGSLAATRRQVTARASATSITVDATVATGTGITMNIGGACATLGGAAVNFASNNTVWVKSGTYTQTSASSNVNAGSFNRTGFILGYGSSRGDFAAKPLIQASGISSFTMCTLGGVGYVRHMIFDCASLTTSTGISIPAAGKAGDCEVRNATSNSINNSGVAINCISTGHTTVAAFAGTGGVYFGCVAKDGTNVGFRDGKYIRCIADSLSGASTDGFLLNVNGSMAANCVAYNCGRDGFRCSTSVITTVFSCIAEDNGSSGAGIGFNGASNPEGLIWANNAAYSNPTDFSLGTGKNSYETGSVTGSGSFFTDAANGDFSLNNTAGAGADAREVGYPSEFNDGDTPNFLDIGVAQHEDTGSSGSGASQYAFFG